MKFSIKPHKDDFIVVVLEEGKYYLTPVLIKDLHYEEESDNHAPVFEIELPKDKVELFKDEEFITMIEKMVGEATEKATESIYKSQTELMDIEVHVGEILKKNNIHYSDQKLLIEQFMAKDYLLQKRDDTYIAIDVKDNTSYDLNNPNELEIVRQQVFPNIILN